MANNTSFEPTPIKYYKFQVGGKTEYEALPFLGNIPFGHTEVGEQEFRQATGSTQQFTSPYTLAGGTTPIDIKSLEQSIAAGQGDPRDPNYAANIQKQFAAQGLPPLQGTQQFKAAVQPQQNNTTQALQQNIVPHPDAPQGWGIDITTGRFAKLTTAQPTAAPTPTQQGTPDRLLGPNEFAGLVKQLQVGPANFDQYFRRTPEGDIYLKGTQATTPSPTAPTTATPTTGITPVSRPIESLKIGGIDIGQFRELAGIPGLIEQENQIRQQLLEAHNALPSRLSLLEQETRKQGLGTIADSIAEIQKTVQSQQNALRDLPEAVKERAVPFKVTASQLQRLTAKEREPMARALADLLTSQNILQQQWDRKHELAKEAAAAGEVDAQRALKGIELQLGFIQSDRKKAENLFEMLIDIARKEKQDLLASLRAQGYVQDAEGNFVPSLSRQREERIAGGATPTGTPTPTAPKPGVITTQAGAKLTNTQQQKVIVNLGLTDISQLQGVPDNIVQRALKGEQFALFQRIDGTIVYTPMKEFTESENISREVEEALVK